MRSSMHFVLAELLAFGTCCAFARADNGPAQAGGVTPATQPSDVTLEEVVISGVLVPADAQPIPGTFRKVEVIDAPGIRQAIAQAAEAVLLKGQEHKLLDCIYSGDRQRLKDSFTKASDQILDQQVAQVQDLWQQRFHRNFNLKHEVAAFQQNFIVAEAEVITPNLMSNQPLPPGEQVVTPPAPAETMGRQGTVQRPQRPTPNERDAAVVQFPAERGLPDTYVSLVREKGSWKLTIPNEINGQQLHDNLVRNLSELNKYSDRLPADSNDAYRYTTHAVMAALYGQGFARQ